MNLIVNLILCGVLLLITIATFMYRKWLENREDHYIHLHGDQRAESVISSQATAAKRLATIDRVKMILVVLVILYILAIVAMVTYNAWNNTGGG